MQRKTVYLLLCVAGAVLPYWQFVPWVLENGLDISLLLNQLFANRASAFFATDVIVSAGGVFVFVGFERSRLGNKWWLPLVAWLNVGVFRGCPRVRSQRDGG